MMPQGAYAMVFEAQDLSNNRDVRQGAPCLAAAARPWAPCLVLCCPHAQVFHQPYSRGAQNEAALFAW